MAIDKANGPEQRLPGVNEALAFRSANMDMMVVTGILAFLGAFTGGTVSALMMGGSPWFFGEPFLSKSVVGIDVYTILPDLISLIKYKNYPDVVKASWVGIGVFISFIAVGWFFGAKKAKKSREALLKSDAHGSAHWSTEREIIASGLLPNPQATKKADTRYTCYVGGFLDSSKNLKYLCHTGPEHVIAFAPTRSGKGVGLVIPTLLAWKGSTVVHDIKGENWALTSGYRKSVGQRCLKFAPTLDDGTSCKFNPLSEIRVGTSKEVSDVQNIATMIVDPDGKGLSDHWAKTGFALLTSSILHVLYSRDIKSKTLISVANLLSDPSVTSVDEIFEMMKAYDHDPDLKMGWHDLRGNKTATHPAVATNAQEMLNKADNEKSGVISTAMSFLSLYRDPVVAANIESSDFSISELMGDAEGSHVAPISLYLVVPPSDKDRLKPLIRLILNQVVRRLTENMEFKDGRSVDGFQHRLLLMIDEFPSLGKLDIFAESLAYVAGYGMKMYLICQDTAQLYAAYGKDEAIIANCHIRVVYAPNRLETGEWVSKMLGKQTLVTENTTFSYNGQFMPYQTGMSGGLQYAGRELLTVDEVMSLQGPIKDASGSITKPGAMITMVAGFPPVYGTQMLYFLDSTFLSRAKIPSPDQAVTIPATPEAIETVELAPPVEPAPVDNVAEQVPEKPAELVPPVELPPAISDLDNYEEKADQARSVEENHAVLDGLRGITEIRVRDNAVDEINRELIPNIPTVEVARSRTQRHRALDKAGFNMLIGG